MFSQIFIFIIGIFSLIIGCQDGDYIWAVCGFIMSLSGVHLIYQLTTGKIFSDKINTYKLFKR